MSTPLLSFADSEIRMRHREPFLTEGLDLKAAVTTPRGIYRGFRLASSGVNMAVTIQADADVADHVAATEDSGGHSLSLRKTGGDFLLSLSSYASKTVVLAIYGTYVLGSETLADVRAYELAPSDEFTSAPEGAYLVVLGTIVVPASGLIPAANITHTRRTSAWQQRAAESIPWSPIVKNPSFEHGVTGGTARLATSDWLNRTDLAVNGAFRIGTSTVRSGAKSLEFNKTAVGAGVGRYEQTEEIPVVPGQLFRVTGWVRQLIAPTGGSYTFNLNWGDLDSTAAGSSSVTASVASTTDASFRKVEAIVAVPATKYVLKTVSIEAAGLTTATTGIALVVDDFQVYAEQGNFADIAAAANARLKDQLAASLIVEDPTSYTLGQLAALLRFDRAAPTSEGTLVMERKDQDYSGGKLPPALALFGRVLALGSQLLGTEANALKARVAAPYSVTGGVEYTLMWESAPASGSVAMMRLFVSAAGSLSFTVNASYDGTNWNKDVNAQEAFRLTLAKDQFTIAHQASGTNTWLDNVWLTGSSVTNGALNLLLGTATAQYVFAPTQLSMKLGEVSNQYVFTPTEMTHAADLIPATTATYKIGSPTVQISKVWARALSLGVNPTDYPQSRAIVAKGTFNTWEGEYLSKLFGIWARKGTRFTEDFFSSTAVPDGWTSGSSGGVTGSVSRDGTVPHTLVATHDGANIGAAYFQSTKHFRLTNGFIARFRVRWTSDLAGGWFGFADPVGNTNAITISVGGAPDFNTAFFVGGTLVGNNKILTGATILDTFTETGGFTQNPGATLYQWFTFSVVGTTLYWSIHTVDPDTELADIDSGVLAPFGSGSITVPTGLWGIAVCAQGFGSGFGSNLRLDYVEVITGTRDG